MLEKWIPVANALVQPLERLPAPLHVLVGEAVQVAWFCEHYWKAEVDAKGTVIRAGLTSVERPGIFEEGIAKELLELQEALQSANTEYLMTTQPGPDASMDRARFVLGELRAVLTYMAEDGVENVDDQRLSNLNTQYQDALSQDAVASALDDYAGFAEMHRSGIAGLGGFDAALIDEAHALAKKLRERSAEKVVGIPPAEARRALELRNRVGTLLQERITKVRDAARFVFRNDPALARRATSAYQRRRRTAANRAKKAVSVTEQKSASAKPVEGLAPRSVD
jgi:hypothetical protein